MRDRVKHFAVSYMSFSGTFCGSMVSKELDLIK